MSATRFTLYAVAFLTGGYASLTWSLAMIDRAAVAAMICALALIAAECIRYCTPRKRGRPPVTFHDGRVRRMLIDPRSGRPLNLNPRLGADVQTGAWTLPDYSWPDDRRAVWPNQIGAPE